MDGRVWGGGLGVMGTNPELASFSFFLLFFGRQFVLGRFWVYLFTDVVLSITSIPPAWLMHTVL